MAGAELPEGAPDPRAGYSIQGESQARDVAGARASEEDVDLYVDSVPDGVLECRERGRHLFPAIRQAGIYFSGVDESGLFIRRVMCQTCGLAVRVEKWEGSRQRGRTRFQRVEAQLQYQTGRDGESYLAPRGRGRMTTRQIGDSLASKAFAGQSLAAIRRAAERAAAAGPDTGDGG
jgi:hypothetical protein